MSTRRDVYIRAGNSGTVENELGLVVNVLVGSAPLDMTGNEIVFRVMSGATQVLRKTSPSGITLANGTDGNGAASAVPNKITVPFTVAENRTLEAAGTGLTYELERRFSGNQRVILEGSLFVTPGANDD